MIFGIRTKLFLWYLILLSIFYGTIFALLMQVSQIMQTSETMVNRNVQISASKKMIESLLSMEENEKKYSILNKKEYKDYFAAAQNEFENNLTKVLQLALDENSTDASWRELYRNYRSQLPKPVTELDEDASRKNLWVPEAAIDDWRNRIYRLWSESEKAVEAQIIELNQRGRTAVHWGFVGLGTSLVVGLLGSMFLGYTMHRPLRELTKGILSIPQRGLSEPIPILSRDEFGELAKAFNEMAGRLRKEERMRSDFISMLSHEIRTPLTSIRESVNLIADETMGTINEKQKRFLNIASEEIERITELLNHLMQVSRMEAGIIEIHPRPLEPEPLILSSIHRLSPAAEAKNVKISSLASADIPSVMGDPEHLQQVLLNLLGNAIKFSPRGSEVLIKVEPNAQHDDVRFSISDNGPGIPEEERMLVFQKYYRASGIKDEVDGVGLGLSISKHIVEAHGGFVWVESQVGRGSTFGFTIPAVGKE
ncbi:MAG: HAMP domain-containing sensor histidine kinase [Desulforhabdus sp.]|nr:HAMP domain-containing sensor histidine kinase [Desulforhabdus sp.]